MSRDRRLTQDQDLLLRLGTALVQEWNALPMATRRALYERAVDGQPVADNALRKRNMAVFLHDHKRPGSPG